MTRIPFTLLHFILPCLSAPLVVPNPLKLTPGGGIHLPIQARTRSLDRRDGQTGVAGLGDVADITYNVLITVGSTKTPVVLDTGSSDLWLLSDACKGKCTPNVAEYPASRLNYSGVDVRLLYGDSFTGTHAFGPIGQDTAEIAGLSMPGQYFAAINNTNTSVIETGSAGIFGLGFPINSVIFETVFKNKFPVVRAKKRELDDPTLNDPSSSPSRPSKRRSRQSRNHPRKSFPKLPSIISTSSRDLESRQSSSTSATIDDVLNAFSSMGPLIPRLVQTGKIAAPQFSMTLQRNTIDVGGNVGMLSIGELPAGVSNNSLTWVPIRRYPQSQGGLPPPRQSPNEVYPVAWEVPIDNVYLDGVVLPRSNISDPSIQVTALIDSGNSLIRGPRDIVSNIYRTMTDSQDASVQSFSCGTPHSLAFEIGGKMFPIDPRDLITQATPNRVDKCLPNVVATDPPGLGYLYSWSLGAPFLKSVVASFYYGNLTHPSQDPPRMGFMSTVPSNANDLLAAAVNSAFYNGGNFPTTSVTAPDSVQTNPGYGVSVLNEQVSVPTPSSSTISAQSSPITDGTKNSSVRTGIRHNLSTPLFVTFCIALLYYY